MGFRRNNVSTELALDFVEDCNSAWKAKPEHRRNKTASTGDRAGAEFSGTQQGGLKIEIQDQGMR